MIKNITLSASMRTNLLSLKNISTQMNKTQNIFATGKKVNNAIDNANNYYQARSLINRASDLSALLDSMHHGIQTIQAAMQGLTSATNLLEQASVVAMDATIPKVENREIRLSTIDLQNYTDAGYEVMTSANSAEMLNKIKNGNIKVVLGEDITLNETINFGNNVLFEGNGHSLNITSSIGYGFYITNKKGISIANLELNFHSEATSHSEAIRIRSGETDISAIKINNQDTYGSGILGYNNSKINLDSIIGISADIILDEGDLLNIEDLFTGEEYTQAIIDEIGEEGLAATATRQFYVGDKNGEFGENTWHLPAIGEWMELYGIDIEEATESNLSGTAGSDANNENFTKVQNALTVLESKEDANGNSVGKSLSVPTEGRQYYLSSSETSSYQIWCFSATDGYRTYYSKTNNLRVRAFQEVENCFNPNDASKPQIGYVLYEDKTWSTAENYDSSKTAVGVIYNINEEAGSVDIINLKDLTFSSTTATNNFNADDPYSGRQNVTKWAASDKSSEDIDAIHNYYGNINPSNNINITHKLSDKAFDKTSGEVLKADRDKTLQYKNIIEQYDKLIQDSSYRGNNLLQNGSLNVVLSESANSYNVNGKNMVSQGVGLLSKNWEYTYDVYNAINELTNAINSIRNFQEELGIHYQIILTRQDFTETLSNILKTGADDLVLADMNETCAQNLMLQTMQQLATNALSLASQASQSILRLF